jgi:branched-chain amino acid aminotransferase
MNKTVEINITKTTKSKLQETDFDNLAFGHILSDHMFVVDYADGDWQMPRIVPYAPLTINPANATLHYGQSIFEGLKAYKNEQGEIIVFRPDANHRRLNESAKRMCIPELPEELFMEGMSQLLDLDRDWVPSKPGCSLYIRPFIFATDEFLGIRPSFKYKFMILTSPVGHYYSKPVSVKVETHYSRAIEGGTGFAKAAGNYAASLYPAKLGRDKGFHQLLWTDGKTHEYIEESGTMNIVFMIDGVLISPSEDSDTILKGITKRTVFDLAKHWAVPTEERRVTVKEIVDAIKSGRMTECFGAGTAATIAQVDVIGYRDEILQLPPIEGRELSHKIHAHIDAVKYGTTADELDWVFSLN